MQTAVGVNCPACHKGLPGAAHRCPHCGHELSSPDAQAPRHLGAVVGNLRLVELLGEGGMGTVYRAEHTTLGTSYAIKVLHNDFCEDAVLAERFRREAVVCSQLRHPNVVFVTDFGLHEQLGLYIAMEHLRGVTLTQRLRQGDVALWEAAQIAQQVCEGLAAAHAQGIIHRDLKPENIMLVPRPSGRPLAKILDFGIVRIAGDRSQNLTQAGMALGTPTYMSPEQVKGSQDLSTAADLYALGVILYEMCAGQPPFQSEQFFELALMHVNELPKPLGQHAAHLADTALERLVMELLHKEPRKRPQEAAEVQRRLQEALEELQHRGVPGALPSEGGGAGVPGGPYQERPTRQTGILRQIRQEDPDSPLGQLLQRLPQLAALPPALCFITIWGVALRGVLDNKPGDGPFQTTAHHLSRFCGALLAAAEESQDSQEEAQLQMLLERSLQDLFALCDRPREEKILAQLRPHLSHPLFPLGALPDWAAPGITGTWTIRNILTSDVRDLFRRKPDQPAPALQPPVPRAPAPAEGGQPAASTQGADTLVEKLQQDISLKSIKSVLSHDLLGRKKKKK